MVAVGFGVALPDVDGVGHQLSHGRLKVVITNHPAGNARRACADPGLVQDDDVATVTLVLGLELKRQMVSSAQPVDTRANNDIRPLCGQ